METLSAEQQKHFATVLVEKCGYGSTISKYAGVYARVVIIFSDGEEEDICFHHAGNPDHPDYAAANRQFDVLEEQYQVELRRYYSGATSASGTTQNEDGYFLLQSGSGVTAKAARIACILACGKDE